jgi:RNA polymerase sigma factor (sigma-70 family)
MRATRTDEAALVVAAQTGDRRALDELVTIHLPLVYTIVRRGLSGHPDVDDVVQDTMVRAVRQLSTLREPGNFRPWLASIALRQVSTHLRQADQAAERTAVLDEAAEIPDADAPSEDLTLLRLELSAQRRQVERASRWLDPDDRALLPLWWLESADQLSRSELAAALGVSVAHAGVRLQRMRTQLEVARTVVAALEAGNGCDQLGAVVADWDGVPSPLWRKRVSRHVRSCAVCAHAADHLIATDRLLPAVALLPVPVAVTATLIGEGTLHVAALGASASAAAAGLAGSGAVSAGAVVKAGLISQLVHAAAVHPVVATVAAGALVAGATVTTTQLVTPPPPPPAVIAAPTPTVGPTPTRTRGAAPEPSAPATTSPSSAAPESSAPAAAGSLPLRPVSLESQNYPGLFVSTDANLGVLEPAGAAGDTTTRARATFRVVPGLADTDCFSFRFSDGRYLRHLSWRVQLSADEGTELFRGDATFCARAGAAAGSMSLESSNYPGWFLRHRDGEVWVDQSDRSAVFRADSSFVVRPPLAG